MRFVLSKLVLLALSLFLFACGTQKETVYVPIKEADLPSLDNAIAGSVQITKKTYTKTDGTKDPNLYYWFVEMDLSNPKNAKEVGKDYVKAIRKLNIDFFNQLENYMAEAAALTLARTGSNKHPFYPFEFMARLWSLYRQVPEPFNTVISGMASESGASPWFLYTGFEFMYGYNLMADVFRETNCSAVGFMKDVTVDDKTIVGRVLDWQGGVALSGNYNDILSRYQAITKIKMYNGKTIYLIGALGNLAGVTVINYDTKIMAAILDAPIYDDEYSADNKFSYPFDLLRAVTDNSSTVEIANYLKDPARKYTYNHLILLGSVDNVTILENNNVMSDNNTTPIRAVRYWNSDLFDNGTHKVNKLPDYIIGAVNSFLLKGQPNNHFNLDKWFSEDPEENTSRWDNLTKSINLIHDPASKNLGVDEMMGILTYYEGNTPPEGMRALYNKITQQIVIYTPADNKAKIFLRPANGVLPDNATKYFFEFEFTK